MTPDTPIVLARLGLPANWPLGWIAAGGALLAVCFVALSLWRQGKRGWGWVAAGFLIIFVLVIWKMLLTMVSREGQWSGRGNIAPANGWSRGGGSRGRW